MNKRVIETNASHRDKGPRGHMGKLEKSRDVKGDWDCQTDVKDVGYDQEWREMDGATSSTCRDSKRVETDLLAEDKACQHEWHKCTRSDIPRPSTPPPEYPRSFTDYVDPPRQRGWMKPQPRKVNRTKMKKPTYQIIRPHRGQSGRIRHIGYVANEVQMLGSIPARYRCSMTLQRSRIQDRVHSALPEPRLTIYGHRSTQPHTDTDSSHRSFNTNSFHWNMKGIHYFVFTYIPLIFPILFEGECC